MHVKIVLDTLLVDAYVLHYLEENLALFCQKVGETYQSREYYLHHEMEAVMKTDLSKVIINKTGI